MLSDTAASLEPLPISLPPLGGTNWVDWLDVLGQEMYLRRALEKLSLGYPSESDS